MIDLAAVVERAWRDGVGPDDRIALRDLLAHSTEEAIATDTAWCELRLFAAWHELMSDVRVELPAAPPNPAGRTVHLAAAIELARIDRDAAQLDTSIVALEAALESLDATDPRAAAARAWADLALGDLARTLDDASTARRRFERVAEPGNPIALRLAAMLRLAAASLVRLEIEPARRWARKAVKLAEYGERYEHGTRARLLLGMLDCASGDLPAMRRTLRPHAKVSALARVLLSNLERASQAMPLLAEGLRVATEQGDTFGYMLCILVGARRYASIGRDGDALITLSTGIHQLDAIAPNLAGVLEQERASWRKSWGAGRFDNAEKMALTILDH